jgi:hypothetical protein
MGTTLVLGDDISTVAHSNIGPGFSYEPLETEIDVFMNDLVTINGTPLSGSSGSGLSGHFGGALNGAIFGRIIGLVLFAGRALIRHFRGVATKS